MVRPPLRAAAPVRLLWRIPPTALYLLRDGGLSLVEPRIQYKQTADGMSVARELVALRRKIACLR